MQNLDLLWQEAFNECIGQEQEKHGSNPVDWKASGRVSKAWPNKENGDWWAEKGPAMLKDFAQVWDSSGWSVWHTPQGIPALELELNVAYGDVLVKAFVDMVAVTAEGELVVVDFKTGANMPSNAMQLGLYACGIEKVFGVRPSHGYYYDAREAQMKIAEGMNTWTTPLFTELFTKFNESVERKVFLPNLGMMCKSCLVKDYCYVYGGEFADMIDPLYSVAQGKGQ